MALLLKLKHHSLKSKNSLEERGQGWHQQCLPSPRFWLTSDGNGIRLFRSFWGYSYSWWLSRLKVWHFLLWRLLNSHNLEWRPNWMMFAMKTGYFSCERWKERSVNRPFVVSFLMLCAFTSFGSFTFFCSFLTLVLCWPATTASRRSVLDRIRHVRPAGCI